MSDSTNTQWVIDVYCQDEQWVIDTYCQDEQWLPFSISSSSSSSSSRSSSSSSSRSSSSSSSSITPGTKTWGQKTGIQEDYDDPFLGHWTGDGVIDGTNNDEVLLYTCPPEIFTSEAWYLGSGRATIRHDKYQVGSGNVTKFYKTASSLAGLNSVAWQEFDGVEFTSLGWVQIRITNELGE